VHLDADEAVAMGAGLFAANMSTTFRMRKFGALDAMPHGMSYEITPSDEFTSSEPTTLVAPFAKTPYAHRVSMFNRTSDAKIIVKLDRSNGSPLPPGTVTDQVMVVDITGVKEAMAKYNDTVGKLNVHFDFDASGILDVSKAEYIVEIIDYVPEKPKKANKSKVDANATAAADNATAAADNATAAADNATAAADNATDTDAEVVAPAVDTTAETEAEVEEEVPKMKMRRRVFRTPLGVAISGLPVESMTDAQIESSIQVLKNLRAKDEAKRAQEAAKSNLEAYIYAMRAKLDEDVIQEVTDEDQRSALKDLLMDKEDWLYMDGADASTEVFKKTHNELKMQGDAMEFRAKELTARPETIAAANKFIKKAKTEIASWAEKKPWLNATHVADLLEEVEQFESWLNEKVEEQNKLSKIETPTLESTEIKVSQRPVEAKFIKLKKKPKPKPIKVAKNATDANATDANVTDANATDYETEPVVEELTFDEVDETIESESWEDEQSGSDADETEEQSDDNNVKDEL
jgi:hypoxia up-regulated 1